MGHRFHLLAKHVQRVHEKLGHVDLKRIFKFKCHGKVVCANLPSKFLKACEHYWSIEGWIHSKRRNRLDQKLVEKLVRVHTNLVMRESLDDTLRHPLPWDIELVIDNPVDEQEEESEF